MVISAQERRQLQAEAERRLEEERRAKQRRDMEELERRRQAEDITFEALSGAEEQEDEDKVDGHGELDLGEPPLPERRGRIQPLVVPRDLGRAGLDLGVQPSALRGAGLDGGGQVHGPALGLRDRLRLLLVVRLAPAGHLIVDLLVVFSFIKFIIIILGLCCRVLYVACREHTLFG